MEPSELLVAIQEKFADGLQTPLLPRPYPVLPKVTCGLPVQVNPSRTTGPGLPNPLFPVLVKTVVVSVPGSVVRSAADEGWDETTRAAPQTIRHLTPAVALTTEEMKAFRLAFPLSVPS